MFKQNFINLKNSFSTILNLNHPCYKILFDSETNCELKEKYLESIEIRKIIYKIFKCDMDIDLFNFNYKDNRNEVLYGYLDNYLAFIEESSKIGLNHLHFQKHKEFFKYSYRDIIKGNIPNDYGVNNIINKYKSKSNLNSFSIEEIDAYVFKNSYQELEYYVEISEDIKKYLISINKFSKKELNSNKKIMDEIFSNFFTVVEYLKLSNNFEKYEKYLKNAIERNKIDLVVDTTTNSSYKKYPSNDILLKFNFDLPVNTLISQLKEIYNNQNELNDFREEFSLYRNSIGNDMFSCANKMKVRTYADDPLTKDKFTYISKLFVFDCYLFSMEDDYIEERLNAFFYDYMLDDNCYKHISNKEKYFNEIKTMVQEST